MTLLARLAPVALILVAVLACALPWGVAPEFRLALPLLPYVVIHRCVERWGGLAPDWLVFLAGFATDIAGQGPLGYWCLIYLCGYTMIRSETANRTHGIVGRLTLFVLTIVCLALMQWSVAAIYYMRAVETTPLVVSVVVALIAYLLLILLLPLRIATPVRPNARLERGHL